MSDNKSIPVLTDNNFTGWKIKIKGFCMQHGYYKYLSDVTQPTDGAALLVYNDKREKLAGILHQAMGQINYQRFITDDNIMAPDEIWSALTDYYESTSAQNQMSVYRDFISFKYRDNVATFLDDLDAKLNHMAAVGLRIGNPKEADLKEELAVETILQKLPPELSPLIDVLHQSKTPLTISIVKAALDNKRRQAPSSTTTSIKQETAYKAGATWPVCKPGWHNPETKHSEEDCRQLKKKGKKPQPAAKAAVETTSDAASTRSLSTASGMVAIRRALAANQDGEGEACFLDSGASHHMFNDRSTFHDYRAKKTLISLADGNFLDSIGEGFVFIRANDGSSIKLKALHVPKLAGTLISLGRLYERECDIQRTGKSTFDVVKNGLSILSGKVVGGICGANIFIAEPGQSKSTSAHLASAIDIERLHRAAGHPNIEALRKMFPHISSRTQLSCEACALSKSHRLSFPSSLPKATRPLEYVFMDLSGRINPPTFGKKEYYFKITDFYTRYRHVYLLSKKSETFSFFVQYYNEVTNHHSANIKTVIFDGGGEFNSNEFLNFLKEKGVTVQVTAPHTPQQNSVAERGNRSTSEKTRCLLKQAKLPSEYWGEAVCTAVFLENITPMKALGWDNPYNKWFGSQFNSKRLKPFGCLCYPNIPGKLRDGKFGDTSKKALLVGYQLGAHNWRVLLPGGKIERCHDIKFVETEFPGVSIFSSADPSHHYDPLTPIEFQEIELESEPNDFTVTHPEAQALDYHLGDDELSLDQTNTSDFITASEQEIEIEGSTPDNQPPPAPKPKPGWDIILTNDKAPKDISSSIDESHILHTKRRAHFACALVASEVPRTYREAMLSSEAGCWTKAVEAELKAMEDLKVWDVTVTPEDESLLGTVWVFRKKKDSEGVVVKFKARLCAQGSRQEEGVNFTHTYAPTGRSASLRAALIVGLSRGYKIHQMDAKNAFLNGNLQETVYLRAPPGLDVPPGHCLRLNKAIYGLKQAPRVWYAALKEFFVEIQFAPSPADPCLFISSVESWNCFVHVYVDDMIIISHDVDRFKQLISARFRMEDLGEASYILGIKLNRTDAHSLTLTQENYTQSILETFNMADCRTTSTPMIANTRLTKATDADHQSFLQLKINYREALGLLNYLSVSTRPDISFTVSQLSQHLEKPGMSHWKAVIHLFRYLAGTKHFGITLNGNCNLNDVSIYTDADFANCTDDRRSYSGYIAMLGGNILSWRSKKQQTVSTSTTEAEYRALFEGTQESIWLKYLFQSLNLTFTSKFNIFVDNQSAIALAINPLFQQRTKHIDTIYHWLREIYDSGLIHIKYIPTQHMKADMCTKSLGRQKHLAVIKDLKIQGN
jgi:histone deacetylase 1/2